MNIIRTMIFTVNVPLKRVLLCLLAPAMASIYCLRLRRAQQLLHQPWAKISADMKRLRRMIVLTLPLASKMRALKLLVIIFRRIESTTRLSLAILVLAASSDIKCRPRRLRPSSHQLTRHLITRHLATRNRRLVSQHSNSIKEVAINLIRRLVLLGSILQCKRLWANRKQQTILGHRNTELQVHIWALELIRLISTLITLRQMTSAENHTTQQGQQVAKPKMLVSLRTTRDVKIWKWSWKGTSANAKSSIRSEPKSSPRVRNAPPNLTRLSTRLTRAADSPST